MKDKIVAAFKWYMGLSVQMKIVVGGLVVGAVVVVLHKAGLF